MEPWRSIYLWSTGTSRSRIRIRIEVKSWIRIRNKVMRIRNPAFICWNFLLYLFLLFKEALFSSSNHLHDPFHFLSELDHNLVRKIYAFLAPHMPWFIVDSSLDPDPHLAFRIRASNIVAQTLKNNTQYGTVFNKNLTFILNVNIRYCVEIRSSYRYWIPAFNYANLKKKTVIFWLFPQGAAYQRVRCGGSCSHFQYEDSHTSAAGTST